MGSLEIIRYPAGICVVAAAQTLFFPYKVIQNMTLKKEGSAEAPIWTLHIRTTSTAVNLSSTKSLDEDFRAVCMHFH